MSISVYLGVGGNVGATISLLQQAVSLLKGHPHVTLVTCSRLYLTSPVSDLPQDPYINAAVRLETSLPLKEFMALTQQIETHLGKRPKEKNAPRPIDIDILFFGEEVHNTEEMTIPHPRWKERLFVLTPLSDLTRKVGKYSLPDLLSQFQNIHLEQVLPICYI